MARMHSLAADTEGPNLSSLHLTRARLQREAWRNRLSRTALYADPLPVDRRSPNRPLQVTTRYGKIACPVCIITRKTGMPAKLKSMRPRRAMLPYWAFNRTYVAAARGLRK